ncbi:MAG: amidophosphoribosyltransferase [Gammaproteobacteria bacterium]|nr:amidophosphoribosyltransferase [Gammaproteobacteria bacterium]MCH9744192.1 amidophosphoribosyltransferase [Gammaproteobacteria bacterium]
MCGIIGILSNRRVNQDIYDALTIIQHRGQDAAGIMTSDGQRVHLRKCNGLVRDAIQEKHMFKLQGNMGIGHVRYPTAGSESASESQPFYVNSPYGLGIVHNGNLINTEALAQQLAETDLRHLNTASDSEVLLNVLAYELQRVGGTQLAAQSLFQAVKAVYQRVQGAFSAIAMIHGYGLLAFRDPYGIRPLVYGKRETDSGPEYMIASETIALDVLGYKLLGDVAPGEAIFIDLAGELHRHQCVPMQSHSPCIFEYIYLARPDSVIDHIPVYKARINMGKRLADKIKREKKDHDIDVVIPIPDTSRTSALALAQALGVDYSEGFVKNRYIGRTFIMPGQSIRRSSVRLKLNAMKEEFKGKNVLLVDDSIVRGTTSGEIIQMARDVGAKKVYFASAAPEVRYPNVYGIDMPNAKELIAHDRTSEEVSEIIGSDWLVYQDLGDVVAAINDAAKTDAHKIKQFEDSIFTGTYMTGGVSEEYLNHIAEHRSDAAKKNNKDKH